jgi:hypothetical protein
VGALDPLALGTTTYMYNAETTTLGGILIGNNASQQGMWKHSSKAAGAFWQHILTRGSIGMPYWKYGMRSMGQLEPKGGILEISEV